MAKAKIWPALSYKCQIRSTAEHRALLDVDVRTGWGVRAPLPNEGGTYTTVKARFWLWHSGKIASNLVGCSILPWGRTPNHAQASFQGAAAFYRPQPG